MVSILIGKNHQNYKVDVLGCV